MYLSGFAAAGLTAAGCYGSQDLRHITHRIRDIYLRRIPHLQKLESAISKRCESGRHLCVIYWARACHRQNNSTVSEKTWFSRARVSSGE
jgi:hypothetical protein